MKKKRTFEGKLRASHLKSGMYSSTLLFCRVCPFQEVEGEPCPEFDEERMFCIYEKKILEEEIHPQAQREWAIKRIKIAMRRAELYFVTQGVVQGISFFEKLVGRFRQLVNDYEKTAAPEAKSFLQLLQEKRKQKEISKDFEWLTSKIFARYNIWSPFLYKRGAFDHNKNVAFVYVDELWRYCNDTYPIPYALDAFIRILSLDLIHEIAHEDHPQILEGRRHDSWNAFIFGKLWRYAR